MEIQKTLEKWSGNKTIVIITLIFVYPLGVYLMWKGEQFNRDLRWMITLFMLIWTVVLTSPEDSTELNNSDYSDCSDTFYANGCTYYRDSSCQVIAQSCD